MSTELTEPVEHTKIVYFQKVDQILMNMASDQVEYTIGDYENEADLVPLQSAHYIEKFSEMTAGPAKDDFKDVLGNIRALARSEGQLGDGTDTDPIG